jgi:hypothetical protein
MVSLPLPLLFFLLCLASTTADYGLDYSFPITDWKVKEDGPFVGKQAMYDKYLLGCRENNPPKFEGDASDLCAVYEFDRLAMNKDQPKSMVVSLVSYVASFLPNMKDVMLTFVHTPLLVF